MPISENWGDIAGQATTLATQYVGGEHDAQLQASGIPTISQNLNKSDPQTLAKVNNFVDKSTAAGGKIFDFSSDEAKTGGTVGGIAGAVIGSIIPGVGTAIGAAVGTLIGTFCGIGIKALLHSTPMQSNFAPFCNEILPGGEADKIYYCESISVQYTKELYEEIIRCMEQAVYEHNIDVGLVKGRPRSDPKRFEEINYFLSGLCESKGFCGANVQLQNYLQRLCGVPHKNQEFGFIGGLDVINGKQTSILALDDLMKNYRRLTAYLCFCSVGRPDVYDAIKFAEFYDNTAQITIDLVKQNFGQFVPSANSPYIAVSPSQLSLSNAGKYNTTYKVIAALTFLLGLINFGLNLKYKK